MTWADESIIQTGSMYSGPPPWTGLCVNVITGQHKGQLGIVRDVNRTRTSSSGLIVTLALMVYTPEQTNRAITVDYDDVREPEHWRTLCEICPLKANQSFFQLNSNHIPKQVEKEYVPLPCDIASRSTTPQPSLDTVTAESKFWNTSLSSEAELLHWIFSPVFNGHAFFVSIAPAHPKFGGFGKYVHMNDHTLSFQKQGGHSEHISAALIHKPNPPPLRTTKHLLAVIEGDHAGQFTRFAISAAEKWDGVDGHFNYVEFYMEMVKYFKEYPKDTKVVNLLEWWNECISYYL
ncbi:hypothetical protein BDP27DRAFT_1436367 [Rhodocollybia butyracea]|uniref:Uncharacterized protein n=1 Tax=Rhodocollybia butyracea TaxID=206335 RepID=A0A9P5P5D8_9AGAR|nr:hypothetical protein BDP27DRAFT_1436367 [Rhodocollybia butyracea]